MNHLKGPVYSIVTPFKQNKEIDFKKLFSYLDKAYESENGTLFHTQGKLKTETGVKDKAWDLNIEGLALKIDVEMYQVKENKDTKTEDKIGGGQTKTTEYTYEDVWSDSEINSSSFKNNRYKNTKSHIQAVVCITFVALATRSTTSGE